MTIEERAKKFVERRTRMPFKQAIEYQGSTYVNAIMQSYIEVATEQKKIDIEKLKDVMNLLMIDTHDKAEIIKAMER